MRRACAKAVVFISALTCTVVTSLSVCGCSKDEPGSRPTSEHTVSFCAQSYSAPESSACVCVGVRRDTEEDSAFVWLSTIGGTATENIDFVPPAELVGFSAGHLFRMVNLRLMEDSLSESTETVILRLSRPSDGYTTVFPETAQVFILDSSTPPDSTAPARIWFADSGIALVERSGYIAVTVRRSNATDSAEVVIETMDRTAISGHDYRSLLGTLRFAPQDSAASTRVYITDDNEPEDQEEFAIILRDPSEGYSVPDSPLVVAIIDNEPRFPDSEITLPLSVGNRWTYSRGGSGSADGDFYSWTDTLQQWIRQDTIFTDQVFHAFRTSVDPTRDALYLRQEGQTLCFVPIMALLDPRSETTLPWPLVNLQEGPGSVDTVFAAAENDNFASVLWTIQNQGRSAVQLPAGIFSDVHVVKVSRMVSWNLGWPGCYDNTDIYYYFADAVA
ncbi:MAG: hypothetical protein KAY32_18095 [Candidatus Eisenbacteria sp.]|nr:hypothetical protein [Candidatus Eisenbacteria bacterium]